MGSLVLGRTPVSRRPGPTSTPSSRGTVEYTSGFTTLSSRTPSGRVPPPVLEALSTRISGVRIPGPSLGRVVVKVDTR